MMTRMDGNGALRTRKCDENEAEKEVEIREIVTVGNNVRATGHQALWCSGFGVRTKTKTTQVQFLGYPAFFAGHVTQGIRNV